MDKEKEIIIVTIKRYTDKDTKKEYLVGTERTVSDKRGRHLIGIGFAREKSAESNKSSETDEVNETDENKNAKKSKN